MDKLIYILFFAVFLLNRGVPFVPRQASWVPELLSLSLSLMMVLRLACHQKIFIDKKYIFLIVLYFMCIFIGVLLNDLSLVKMVAGLRFHLKHLPFFLLPAMMDFSDWEFRKQLKFIILLLLLQLPVTVFQRAYSWLQGMQTGDGVVGTLGEGQSGTLTITLVCAFSILVAFYLKKRISRRFLLVVALCLFLPTAINETKVTIALLPFATILPVLFSDGGLYSKKIRDLVAASLCGLLLLAIFVPIYNQFIVKRDSGSLSEMWNNSEYLEKYMYTGAQGKKATEDIRRIDLLVLSYNKLSSDLFSFWFGNGVGSAARSYLDSSENAKKEANSILFSITSLCATYLWWEMGLLGLSVYVCFIVFLYRDSRFLTRSSDVFGTFALGWSAVVVIYGLCLVYQNAMACNVLNLPFWYFSGLMAAKTYGLRQLRERYASTVMNSGLLRTSWGSAVGVGRN
jgi:hypothetical protein